MNKILSFIILIFLTSCEKEDNSSIHVQSITFSDCLQNNTNNVNCGEYQVLNNNYIKFKRPVYYNCGVDSVDINLNANDTLLNITETTYHKYVAYCNCFHFLEYEVGPLTKKQYIINIIGENTNLKFIVDTQMKNVIDYCK